MGGQTSIEDAMNQWMGRQQLSDPLSTLLLTRQAQLGTRTVDALTRARQEW